MVHNWQNTGQQKELFEQSKCKPVPDDNLRKLRVDQIRYLSQCPFNCGQRENHLHYMECMAAQAMTKRRELVKKCQKIFENYS